MGVRRVRLTKREAHLVELFHKHLFDRERAELMGCSIYTLKKHYMNLYEKIGLSSKKEVLAWIWQHRFQQLEDVIVRLGGAVPEPTLPYEVRNIPSGRPPRIRR